MYYLLILAIGIERLVELIVSKRNARWAFAHGGKEFGRSHYPVMVTVHAALLLGCVGEVWALHRPFIAWLGWPMLALVALSQALRWWCVATLGRRWNTLVIVVPQAPLVRRGPVPLAASPELCGRRRRRCGAAAGAYGLADRGLLHAGQRVAADGADQGGKRGAGLYMSTRAADDAERSDAEERRS